ncbi:MAG: secretin N-terminal domain-containing protein, partial [Candidatus Omnitrophota bacterium]
MKKLNAAVKLMPAKISCMVFFIILFLICPFVSPGAEEPSVTGEGAVQQKEQDEDDPLVIMEVVEQTESAEVKADDNAQINTAKIEEKEPPKEGLKQRLSLNLKDMDVVEALKYLATKAGLNIVTTKAVTGRVNLTLEDVSVKDVFDIILRSNSLAHVKQADIYNVMTEAEYKTLFGANFFDMRKVSVFRLKYAIPDQAFSLLDALKSEIGMVLVDAEAENVLIMDTPEKIVVMQEALEEFEKENKVEVFVLKYARAKDVEEILKTQLDLKKVGFVKADERNNQLIVQTLPQRMNSVARLIQNLDRQTKEVLLDIKIVKIALSDEYANGVEWEGLLDVGGPFGTSYVGSTPFSYVGKSTDPWQSRYDVINGGNIWTGTENKYKEGINQIGSYPFSGTTSVTSSSQPQILGTNLHFGMIDPDRDFDVLLKNLQTLGKTQILSNPKLVVVNNQEAKIHVGERQAYVTTTTTTGQTTSAISEEVTFVDVGIQFSVTLNINDDGYITMKVKPEISSVSGVLTTPTNNKIPIIDTSMAETTVMMKDNVTLIIGGLRKEEKTSVADQFPFLGNIPLLGSLFRSGGNKLVRTELLILITPHIISCNEFVTG